MFRTNPRNGSSEAAGLFAIFAILAGLSLLIWAGFRVYEKQVYEIRCGQHLKRAADANTIELAKNELEEALKHMEERGMTSGYTSILYNSPSEDVGFWYNNIKASLSELNKVEPNASMLEKTNVLMKLRETLLDTAESSVSVTAPDGISIFPHNTAYCWCAVISIVLLVLFGLLAKASK